MAERHFGVPRPRPAVDPEELPSVLATVVTSSGPLWNQQAYLAEVWERTEAEGAVYTGLQPLQAFVDDAGPDAVAASIETTGDGSIRPVLYVRRGGSLEEHPLEEHPLFDYRGPRYVLEIARIVKGALT
ncbi:MAG: hypothetical protein WD770_00145, partial [Actinomycetota bacterium]